jgi:hypothetical protein
MSVPYDHYAKLGLIIIGGVLINYIIIFVSLFILATIIEIAFLFLNTVFLIMNLILFKAARFQNEMGRFCYFW